MADTGPIVGPIMAAPGASPATASQPGTILESERFHRYDGNPAPWWIALLWVSFFVFGAVYLFRYVGT